MNSLVKPENTYALIVGIDKYNYAPLKNLDGAANDAIKFANFLLSKNVDQNNIKLFVSFSEKSKNNAEKTEIKSLPATLENISNTVNEFFLDENIKGELLYLFWTGHGCITKEKGDIRRRLFTSDCNQSDYKNIDFKSLASALQTSSRFKGFSHQIFLIDACAVTFFRDNLNLDKLIASGRNFAASGDRKHREQFIFYAAPEYKAALNDQKQKTGLFFQKVIKELEQLTSESLLPNIDLLIKEVREQLETEGNQKPIYLWFRDRDGSEQHFGSTFLQFTKEEYPISPKEILWTSIFLNILITFIVLGIRYLGMFQTLELSAFDFLMRLRPPEKPDPHILVVAATGTETKEDKYGFPIEDNIVADVIHKINSLNPQIIGLDIYRETSCSLKNSCSLDEDKLAREFKTNERLISICKVEEPLDLDASATMPHPSAPIENVGFSDVVVDPYKHIRRHLLFLEPKPNCDTNNSFSVLLALNFLNSKNIEPQADEHRNMELNNVVFKPIESRTGGYQGIDSKGSQVLLNYRSYAEVAQWISFEDVLKNRVRAKSVEGKIIIIGVRSRKSKDYFSTPYGEMPGVFIHAHMVSQIVSAALYDRPLLKTLPWWKDSLWIWFWSIIGVLLALRFKYRLLYLILGNAIAVIVLVIICQYFLLQGIWIALIPSAIALVVTNIGIVEFINHLSLKSLLMQKNTIKPNE